MVPPSILDLCVDIPLAISCLAPTAVDQRDHHRFDPLNAGHRHADRFAKSSLRHRARLVHLHHVWLLYGQPNPVCFSSLLHKGKINITLHFDRTEKMACTRAIGSWNETIWTHEIDWMLMAGRVSFFPCYGTVCPPIRRLNWSIDWRSNSSDPFYRRDLVSARWQTSDDNEKSVKKLLWLEKKIRSSIRLLNKFPPTPIHSSPRRHLNGKTFIPNPSTSKAYVYSLWISICTEWERDGWWAIAVADECRRAFSLTSIYIDRLWLLSVIDLELVCRHDGKPIWELDAPTFSIWAKWKDQLL